MIPVRVARTPQVYFLNRDVDTYDKYNRGVDVSSYCIGSMESLGNSWKRLRWYVGTVTCCASFHD